MSAPTDAHVAGLPILSEVGAWAAWVDQKPGTGEQLWHARRLLGGDAKGVELIFKQIKQHLQVKAFCDTSDNTVRTLIWIAVSVYALVAFQFGSSSLRLMDHVA